MIQLMNEVAQWLGPRLPFRRVLVEPFAEYPGAFNPLLPLQPLSGHIPSAAATQGPTNASAPSTGFNEQPASPSSVKGEGWACNSHL